MPCDFYEIVPNLAKVKGVFEEELLNLRQVESSDFSINFQGLDTPPSNANRSRSFSRHFRLSQ